MRLIDSLIVWFRTEPTTFQALIQSVIALGLVFSWWHWSTTQTGAVTGLAAVLLSLVVRSQVTPTYSLSTKVIR